MATLSAFSTPSPPWPNPNPSSDPNPNAKSDLPDHEERSQRTELEDVDSPPNSRPTQNFNPNIQDGRLSPSSVPSLLHISFNQDYGCFATGTDRGFRVYTCDPFREIFRRDLDRGGGIGVVEMRLVSNLMALVGGGSDPQYPLNKVMIWDDYESRCIGELSFRSEVRAVRLQLDRIVVVLEQKIFVYNFADLKLLHQMETIANPKGLCAVSQVAGSIVLVCPGLQKGQVRVEHYASKRTKFIAAHESRIASFALSMDGQLLATASSKGTLVRIYNTMDGVLLQEVLSPSLVPSVGLELGTSHNPTPNLYAVALSLLYYWVRLLFKAGPGWTCVKPWMQACCTLGLSKERNKVEQM
eukprot:XP_019076875.1 PREDICTED: autophagy-related protein 18a isoform X2 [Vitis vinifera]